MLPVRQSPRKPKTAKKMLESKEQERRYSKNASREPKVVTHVSKTNALSPTPALVKKEKERGKEKEKDEAVGEPKRKKRRTGGS